MTHEKYDSAGSFRAGEETGVQINSGLWSAECGTGVEAIGENSARTACGSENIGKIEIIFNEK